MDAECSSETLVLHATQHYVTTGKAIMWNQLTAHEVENVTVDLGNAVHEHVIWTAQRLWNKKAMPMTDGRIDRYR
jgi:hypothetical protein